MADTITLYTHPDCSYSEALKTELDDLEVGYVESDLSLDPAKWAAVEELTGGERITPVMVTGDVVEVGFHGVG